MILIGDLGGTKTHFAVYDPYNRVFEKKYKNEEFNNFVDLLTDFLKLCPHKVECLSLGIAGPIKDEKCNMSNLDWIISKKDIIKSSPIKNVILLNDLEAFGYGLQALKEEDLFSISASKPIKDGHKGLLVPGTGLGVAQILWDGKNYKSIPTEAGHCDFAPKNQKEIKLLEFLYKKEERAFYDQILSGRGIYHLYQFICEDEKISLDSNLKGEIEKKGPSRFIIEKAIKENDQTALKTLSLFINILGHKAGDLALHLLPIGGVYLGGGIIKELVPLFKNDFFYNNFISKGKIKPFLSEIPVSIILKEDILLDGSALFTRSFLKI